MPRGRTHQYDLGTQNCCGLLKTRSLLDALEEGDFDAAFGGARRDEEKSRAKERVYSFRDATGQWDPKNQRPELWSLYNSRLRKGESIRVFPLSNWTELDIWLYLYAEKIPIVPLYFAKERPITVCAAGALTLVHEEMKLFPGEKVEQIKVRMRSLGCAPCTGAMRSDADTLPKIIEELITFRRSERENRAIDHDEEGSMEVKKAGGIFLVSTLTAALPEHYVASPAFQSFLDAHLGQEMLRFTHRGQRGRRPEVSTLIGRLLHDTKSVYEDQLAAVKKSRVNRAAKGYVDFSLLTDGLKEEREQGITIDVAYRYFSTARRKFIIADTPGHEQYTRNMATGASTADVAIILIDANAFAKAGSLLPQSRRHTYIASLLGIPHVVAAVNKMDLVGYSQESFEVIRKEFEALCGQLGLRDVSVIPVSALEGDNIVTPSAAMSWYQGPTLLEYLETVPLALAETTGPMRFPVQLVLRPDANFRGFAGQVARGTLRAGDRVMALPSRRETSVRRIVTYDGDLAAASYPQSVTVELEDEIDLSRGEMLVAAEAASEALPDVSNRFHAMVVWMNEDPLVAGRTYIAKHTTRTVRATARAIRLPRRHRERSGSVGVGLYCDE